MTAIDPTHPELYGEHMRYPEHGAIDTTTDDTWTDPWAESVAIPWDVVREGISRRLPHLSECMTVMYPHPDSFCTCNDFSPEWD